jgi:hypothetical protein
MDLATQLLIRLDRSRILDVMGFRPDAWQRRAVNSESPRLLLNTHRQSGKSTCSYGLALATAIFDEGSLTLIVSRSLRQSQELFRKVTDGYRRLGSPISTVEDNANTLALSNGSRVVSLPNSPESIVGYSAPRLILIDEAARVSDETYLSLAPMMAISRGRIVAMSTPLGKRGWWSEAWHDQGSLWERIRFTAAENPRIDPAWLAEQRLQLGERWWRQDFFCEFQAVKGQVFSTEAIEAAFTGGKPPLFQRTAS